MNTMMLKAAAMLAPGPTMRWAARKFLTPRPLPLTEQEREALGTATRVEMIPSDTGRLRVFVWGEDGPTVLLVHGWNGSVGQMTPLVSPLRRRGFRVIAHEAPAHGASEGTIAHVPAMALAVSEVVRRFETVHAVVGHSIGATAIARAMQRGVAVGRAAFIAAGTGPRRWVAKFAAAAGLSADAEARLAASVEEIAGTALADLELEAIAPELHAPVLAIHDWNDALVPFGEARRAIEAMPRARLVQTNGLGHFRIVRDATVVQEVTAFVDSGARAASPRLSLAS